MCGRWFLAGNAVNGLPEYRHIGVGREDGETRGEYSAIMYNADRLVPEESGTFWFCDTPDVPGCTSYGNNIPRISTWGRFRDLASGAVFYHYNCHMDHQSATSRELSAAQLVRAAPAAGAPLQPA